MTRIKSILLPKSNKTFDDLISKDFDEVFVPTLIFRIHFRVFNQKRRFFVEMKKDLNVLVEEIKHKQFDLSQGKITFVFCK